MPRPVRHVTSHHGSILLTGFGPFPDVPSNVTAKLVPDLGRRARKQFPAHRIVTRILPTEWHTGPVRLARLLRRESPVLALHFGVATGAAGLRIETVARNACRDAADATGAMPLAPLLSRSGPGDLEATIPTRDIERRLSALGLPAHLSDDAGGYLCNAILYHSLLAACGPGNARLTGFIHIPPDLSGPPLTYPDAVRASLEIIRVCLAHTRH